MTFFGLFGKRKKAEAPLWDHGVSIYQHISNNLDPQSGRLKKDAYTLPDDERRFKPGELRWVPGAMDGAFGHYGGGRSLKQADEIANLLFDLSRTGSRDAERRIYDTMLQDTLLDYIDPALEKAIDMGLSSEPYLHDFAKLLATRSPDRGPVKFGITASAQVFD